MTGQLLQVLGFFLLFVGGMLIYHTYLALTNQTTYEASYRDRVPYLKDVPEQIRPFSRGITKNLWSFFCAKRPLKFSLEDFRGTSDAGASRAITEDAPAGVQGRRNRR
jgi:palmitoyltransferase